MVDRGEVVLERSLEVIDFTDEEGRFGGMMGSMCIAGLKGRREKKKNKRNSRGREEKKRLKKEAQRKKKEKKKAKVQRKRRELKREEKGGEGR